MNNMKWLAATVVLVTGSAIAQLAFAHAVVSPKQVSVGAYQTFVLAVPSEADVPTVGLRLLVPDGLQHVTPNVKAGCNCRCTGGCPKGPQRAAGYKLDSPAGLCNSCGDCFRPA